MKNPLALSAAVFLLSIPTTAQPPGNDRPVVAVRQSTGFVLEAGVHDLRDVIDRAAVFLGRNILLHPQEFQSSGEALEIQLHKRIEVDAPGCWELLNTLLYHKGFAIVPLDIGRGFYEVLSMNGPRRAEIGNSARFVPPEKVAEYAAQKATPILTSFPLVHVNATVATNSLRPFFASAGTPMGGGLTLGNVGTNSAILLQGLGPQVAAACELLRLVDTPPSEVAMEFEVVRLEHAVAAEVVSSLQRSLNAYAGGATASGAPMQSPPPRIVPHASLNAVVIGGTKAELADIRELIATLDVPAAAPPPPSADLSERIRDLERRVRELEKAAGK